MKLTTTVLTGAALACLLTAVTAVRPQAAPPGGDDPAASWSPKAAAAYMDQRQQWWSTWPNAARDHGTFCVSCHTALPYALGRPALRQALGESGPSAPEIGLLDNITKRVTMWRDVEPFYPDQLRGIPKTSESRATEAVLNAVILSSRDARGGQLTETTRRALENMWALQMKTGEQNGAWTWLNFHYEPWEADDSPYFGASLAAVAVGVAPGGYAATAEIQDRAKALRDYFQRVHEKQHLFSQVLGLWASTAWPGLLTPAQQHATIEAVAAVQQADGGWSLASMTPWKRVDGSATDTRSDGYATGLVTLALQRLNDDRVHEHVAGGLRWLHTHQDRAGMWPAVSPNKQRDPATEPAKFMSDAATAFAVLALESEHAAGGQRSAGRK